MDERDPQRRPTVALLVWGDLYDEDFLNTVHVSLEDFATEMTGGYLFNYVEALARADVRSIIVAVASGVKQPTRMIHRATGAPIFMLPPPALYRPLRTLVRSGRVRSLLAAFPRLLTALVEVAQYLATPCRSLIRVLRQEGCQAILCQEYEYPRFDVCVILSRWIRIPVFATFQGGNLPGGILQRLVRAHTIKASAGLVIAPSLEIGRVQLRYGVPDEKIARIFNPVDPDAFQATSRSEARSVLGLPATAQVVVWHGRVERIRKGIDVLLDAWVRVCNDRPDSDLRLLLTGTGRDSDWLKQRIEEPGVRGIHWQDDYIHDRSVLRLRLSAADVFVFPSRHEGFPVAPLEAMACGVPVVASAADGVPDIFEANEADGGLVVPVGDAEALAEALGRVLDHPDLRTRLGRAALQRARTFFSVEPVGQQLRDFLFGRAATGVIGSPRPSSDDRSSRATQSGDRTLEPPET